MDLALPGAPTPPGEALSARWAKGEGPKLPFIHRAREFAAVTAPYLAPDVSSAALGKDLPQPFQSIGGRGVSNLAARLTLVLFPPQIPFFTYELNPVKFAAELGRTMGKEFDFQKTEDVDEFNKKATNARLALARREREIQRHLDATGFRAGANEACQHLIVSGNYLLRYSDGGQTTGFRLDQFQVRRGSDGNVNWILVRESVSRDSLPKGVPLTVGPTTAPRPPEQAQGEVDFFTASEKDADGTWTTWQEAGESRIGEIKKGIHEDDLPWQVLRFIKDSNEDYGRGFGDILGGDVRSLEGLEQAILEVAALSANVVFLVDPGCLASPNQLAMANSGDYLSGNADLVKAIKVDKTGDMAVPAALAAEKRSDLRAAFLMRSAVRRDGERVTAAEIQQVALELEEALGGIFSLQSTEFQRPVVRRMERILERLGELPKIPMGVVRTSITAGIDALGRGRDAIALRNFIADAREVFGDRVVELIDPTEYLSRTALANGIDPEGLVRSKDDAQQVRTQGQMDQFVQDIGPKGIEALVAASGGKGPPQTPA